MASNGSQPFTALRRGNLLVVGLDSKQWRSAKSWRVFAWRDGKWVELSGLGNHQAFLLREAMEKGEIDRTKVESGDEWNTSTRHTVNRLKKMIKAAGDLGCFHSSRRCVRYEPSDELKETASGDAWDGIDALGLRPGTRKKVADKTATVDRVSYGDHLAQMFAGSPAYQVPGAFRNLREWLLNPHSTRVALVLGGAGCGKSRLVYQLSQVEEGQLLPLRARDVVDDARSQANTLWEAILKRAGDYGGDMATRVAEDKTIAVLDGVDEAFPTYHRDRGSTWDRLEDLLGQVGRKPHRLVLTLRTSFDSAYRNRLVQIARRVTATEMDVDPLTHAQLEQLWTGVYDPGIEDSELCQQHLRDALLVFPDLCQAPRVLLNLARFAKAKGRVATTRYEVFDGLFEEEEKIARVRGVPDRWAAIAATLLLRQQQTQRVSDTISAQVPAVEQHLTAMKFPIDALAETAFFLAGPSGEVTVVNRGVTEFLLARALFCCARGAPSALADLPMLRYQAPHAEVVCLFGQAGRRAAPNDHMLAVDNLLHLLGKMDRNDNTFLTSNLLSLLASIYRGPLREAVGGMQGRLLPRAILNGADLTAMDFTGADLTNAVFGGVCLAGAKFVRATLKMVYLSSPAEIRDLDTVAGSDGRTWFAWAKADGSVRVSWCAAGEPLSALVGDRLTRLLAHHDKVNQVRWIGEGRLLSCSNDATLRVWERLEGNRWAQRVLWLADGSIECLRLSPFAGGDVPRWALSGHRGSLAVGSTRMGEARELSRTTRDEHPDMRFACVFLSNDTVLSTCFGGDVHLVHFDADRTHPRIQPVELPPDLARPAQWFAMDFFPAKGLVALGGREGVLVGAWQSGRFVWNPKVLGHGRVRGLRFLRDGALVWSESGPARLCACKLNAKGAAHGKVASFDLELGNGWAWGLLPLRGTMVLAGTTSGEILRVDTRIGVRERMADREHAHLDIAGMDLTGQVGLTAERVESLKAHGAIVREEGTRK